MKFKIALVLTLLLMVSNKALVWAQDTMDGYHGMAWGTSLKSFTSAQHSFSASSVERVEARTIDYLLMDFHEVDVDDSARPTKFNDQRIAGDRTDHVFYDGQYQLAVVPISADNEDAVQKELDSKYKIEGSKIYNAYWDFKAPYGWEMMGFNYRQYQKSPGTRVYLVRAAAYLEDGSLEDSQIGDSGVVVHDAGPSRPVEGFLIYVSDDYFKSSDNAWADYQADKKSLPETLKAAKDQRRQDDLSSIE